jgi:NADH pyrophosphatase NudC (nudix superfamily)
MRIIFLLAGKLDCDQTSRTIIADILFFRRLLRKGLHNYAYPRTDPVIIMGILDPTGEKMLMGRQVRPSPVGDGAVGWLC